MSRFFKINDSTQRLGLIALMLPMLALWSCEKPPAAQAPGPPPPSQVSTYTVEKVDVPGTMEFVGQTGASSKVDLRARVPGFLMQRAFKEGGKVKKGDLLFQIDPRSYQADVDIARANQVKAEASLHQAQREVTRIGGLVERGAASKRELDDAKTAEEQATASIQLAKSNLAKAELDLSYTTINCPWDGLIGEAAKHEGSYVDAGANSFLADLLQTDPIYGYFPLSERDRLEWTRMIADGRIRMPADKKVHMIITLADGSHYDHEGIINYTDVETNPETGTATLRADFPNPEYKLAPGQFIRASAIGWTRVGVIIVPLRAILQTDQGAFVFTVDESSKAQIRPVTLGSWYAQGWIIDKGLNEGDKVVVDGLEKIGPGAPVNVTSEIDPATVTPGATASQPEK